MSLEEFLSRAFVLAVRQMPTKEPRRRPSMPTVAIEGTSLFLMMILDDEDLVLVCTPCDFFVNLYCVCLSSLTRIILLSMLYFFVYQDESEGQKGTDDMPTKKDHPAADDEDEVPFDESPMKKAQTILSIRRSKTEVSEGKLKTVSTKRAINT